MTLDTRPLAPDAIVLSIDAKAALQPCPRPHATKPAQPGTLPTRVELAYKRHGALPLLAAFDTRAEHLHLCACAMSCTRAVHWMGCGA